VKAVWRAYRLPAGFGGAELGCPAVRSWRRTATVIVALFAFLCQSIALQAHFHPQANLVSRPSASSLHVGVHERRSPPDQPADCPLCRELAQSGVYLTPGQVTVSLPVDSEAQNAAAFSFRSTLANRSHAWRSRAPPTLPNA